MLGHLAEDEAYSESRPETERFSCGSIRLWDLPLSLKRSDRSLQRSEGLGFLATQHLEEGNYHSPYTISSYLDGLELGIWRSWALVSKEV